MSCNNYDILLEAPNYSVSVESPNYTITPVNGIVIINSDFIRRMEIDRLFKSVYTTGYIEGYTNPLVELKIYDNSNKDNLLFVKNYTYDIDGNIISVSIEDQITGNTLVYSYAWLNGNLISKSFIFTEA